MGVGVLVGLAVSLSIAFYLNRTPLPFMSGAAEAGGKERRCAKTARDRRLAVGAPPAPRPVPKSPSSTFTASSPVPRNRSPKRRSGTPARESGQQDAAKDVYFIQAGSFQNPADADNQKARLAILGFESSVEPANLPDKGTWYRVRMGPYAKLDEINKVRQALAQNGIDASLIKVKDQQ